MEVEGLVYPADLCFYRRPPGVLPALEPVPRAAWRAPPGSAASPGRPTPFYAAFRRLALFSKWVGCFPAVVSATSSHLSFSWRSPSAVVSTTVSVSIEIALLYYEQAKSGPMIGILIVYLAVALSVRLLFFYNIPVLIELVQLMDELAESDVFENAETKSLNFKVAVFISASAFVFLTVVSESSPVLMKLATLNFVIPTVVVSGILNVVGGHAAGLWRRLEAAVAGLSLTERRRPEAVLEAHRIAHARLLSCVRLLEKAFGDWLAVLYVFLGVSLVHESYRMVYGFVEATKVMKVAVLLSLAFYQAVVINQFQEKNKMILVHIFKMSLNPCADNELFQLTFFQRQVEMNEPTVSAAGLVDVNKEIIPKAIALFASYFIAAIQIVPQMRGLMDEWEREHAMGHAGSQ